MRILILVSKLTGGGAERVASLWAKGFVNNGNKVAIVINSRKTTPVSYEIPHSVIIYNIWTWFNRLLNKTLKSRCLLIRQIRKVVLEFKPDVIIGVMHPWAEYAFRASEDLEIPIVNTEHNSFERSSDYPLKKTEWKGKWIWNKHFNHITVLTKEDKQYLNNHFKNVSVLPNPLAFTPVDTIPQKQKIILAVGRLDVWYVKGFDVLIEAWVKISCLYPDWKLQIAGDGAAKSKEYLLNLVETKSLAGQVEFLGFCNNMEAVYKRASIFVLSSRYEGFGMALIEAMSQGCAPIACDFKGRQKEIITTDKEGIICPANNEIALAEAISSLIDNEMLRECIQINAVKRSRYYSLDNIMNIWDEIFNEVFRENKEKYN